MNRRNLVDLINSKSHGSANGGYLIIVLLLWNVLGAFSQVSPPDFSILPGTYQKPIAVTLTCPTPNAEIHYTTDGSEPTTSSTVFLGEPVLVVNHSVGNIITGVSDNDPDPTDTYEPQTTSSLTIKAIAVKGVEVSALSTATYVLDLVDATLNIPYADPPPAGGSKHMLDVYQPHNKWNTPVLFFIHGGAWRQGDKNLYMELGNTFSGYYNFTTVVANYQLSSDPWYAVHPTHMNDVAMGFKWVVDNIAAYGGDVNKIYVLGQSAGGHLLSLLATDSTYLYTQGLSPRSIKKVISMSGAYDLYDLVAWPINPLNLSASEVLEYKSLCLSTFGSWDKATLDSASPARFISPDQPTFYLINLNETETFLDMPGFSKEASDFYNAVINLNGPKIEQRFLNESDIPAEILGIDYPGNSDGHYAEIYAINSKFWDSKSTKTVVDIIGEFPAPPIPEQPAAGSEEPTTNTVLVWHSDKLATYYRLQLATSSSFEPATLVVDRTVVDTLFAVTNLSHQTQYYWRIKALSAAGESEWCAPSNFSTSISTDARSSIQSVPQQFMLNLYPNPFNKSVNMHIKIQGEPQNLPAQIEIVDVLGRKLLAQTVPVHDGENNLIWKPAPDRQSGTYFINIKCGGTHLVKQVVYTK